MDNELSKKLSNHSSHTLFDKWTKK